MALEEKYSNLINVPLSLTGTKKDKFDQIDFSTDCDCQITACDGGTIKFCAPVSFDPPLPHPGFNPCNYGLDLEADNFVARENYRLADSTSTCSANVGEITALTYLSDGTVPAAPVLSTKLECGVNSGLVLINNAGSQPILNPPGAPFGIKLQGSDLDHLKNILIKTSSGTTHSAVKIDAQGLGGQINLHAQDSLTLYSDAHDITLTSATGKIIGTAQNDIDITSNTGNIVLSAVGGINTEITATGRDAVRLLGDISPTPAVISPPTPEITYPYATAFSWVQHGEIGHSGAGYWGLPDEGQRVGSQTFPAPPPPGIKLWSCNFSPQDEQLAGNGSFSHAGFSFESAISNITGTPGVNRSWTCTSSILPDGEHLVIGTPDPMTVNYHSAIGSLAKPITTINATTLESTIINAATVDATTVNATTVNATTVGTALVPIPTIKATDIDAVDITATGRVTGTRVNTGMGYAASGAPGTPPAHNYGAPGDEAGDIAFQTFTNGIDFYCCFQDYADAPTPGVDRIWWRSPRFNQNF